MIREFQTDDIDSIAQLWLDTNIEAHNFINEQYWKNYYEVVKELLAQAELYVYEKDNQILGFIGLNEDYIAGIFVRQDAQTKGIGKQLLDYVKSRKERLSLNVYQKNTRAVKFYKREDFKIQQESIDEETNEKDYSMLWIKK